MSWDGQPRRTTDLAQRAARQGDESAIPSILNHRALVELLTGRWLTPNDRSTTAWNEPVTTTTSGRRSRHCSASRRYAAWRGDVVGTLEAAREALGFTDVMEVDHSAPREAAARGGESAVWALSHLALVRNDPHTTCRWLSPLREHLLAAGVAEPGEMPWLGDEIEALVGAGRYPEAEQLIDIVKTLAERVGRQIALARAARGRGLLAGARGDLDAERASLDEARQLFESMPLPLEQARTLLAIGGRRRRRHASRPGRPWMLDDVASPWSSRTWPGSRWATTARR